MCLAEVRVVYAAMIPGTHTGVQAKHVPYQSCELIAGRSHRRNFNPFQRPQQKLNLKSR